METQGKIEHPTKIVGQKSQEPAQTPIGNTEHRTTKTDLNTERPKSPIISGKYCTSLRKGNKVRRLTTKTGGGKHRKESKVHNRSFDHYNRPGPSSTEDRGSLFESNKHRSSGNKGNIAGGFCSLERCVHRNDCINDRCMQPAVRLTRIKITDILKIGEDGNDKEKGKELNTPDLLHTLDDRSNSSCDTLLLPSQYHNDGILAEVEESQV